MQKLTFEQLPDYLQGVFSQIMGELTAVKAQLAEQAANSTKPTGKPLETLYTRQETADYFKVELSTLNEWTKQGKIIAYRTCGRVYYKQSEIEKVLQPINYGKPIGKAA